jgi:hypothetical protein
MAMAKKSGLAKASRLPKTKAHSTIEHKAPAPPKRSMRKAKREGKKGVIIPIHDRDPTSRLRNDLQGIPQTPPMGGVADPAPISTPQQSVEMPMEKPEDGEKVTIQDLKGLTPSGVFSASLDSLVAPNDRSVIREYSNWVWWWRQDKNRYKGPKYSAFVVQERAKWLEETKQRNYEIYTGFMREIREAFPPGITDARRLAIAEKLLIRVGTLHFSTVFEPNGGAGFYLQRIKNELTDEIDTSRRALGLEPLEKAKSLQKFESLALHSIWAGDDDGFRVLHEALQTAKLVDGEGQWIANNLTKIGALLNEVDKLSAALDRPLFIHKKANRYLILHKKLLVRSGNNSFQHPEMSQLKNARKRAGYETPSDVAEVVESLKKHYCP